MDVYSEQTKLKQQLAAASIQQMSYALIVRPDEIVCSAYTLKDLTRQRTAGLGRSYSDYDPSGARFLTTYGCNVVYVARSDYTDHTFLHQHLDIILNMGHPKRLQNTFPLILGAQRPSGAGSLLTRLSPYVCL